MKKYKWMLCAISLLVAMAATAADNAALKFTFVKDSVPGATMTEPGGINNAGVSVGIYLDKNGVQHGYILNGKKLTKLDDPNGAAGTTAGSNVNPNGAITVVGPYTNSSGNSVGF